MPAATGQLLAIPATLAGQASAAVPYLAEGVLTSPATDGDSYPLEPACGADIQTECIHKNPEVHFSLYPKVQTHVPQI